MEHYRSVFATTAVMVLGLVATSPLLQRQDSDVSQPRANLMMSSNMQDSGGGDWSDPPRRVDPVAKTGAEGRREEGEASPRPASFTLLPPETVTLLAASGTLASSEPSRQGQSLRRHRATKVASRVRPDVTPRPATPEVTRQDSAQPDAPPQPRRADGVDPIGDILRGLGIGKDS